MLTYISYGKKIYRRKEGLAADFCPICRRACAVEVFQIRSQTHVYDIGFGQGDLVGRVCRCAQCGTEWPLRSGTIETLIKPTVPISVESLLAETYPRFREVNAERLRLEEAIRRDPHALVAGTRAALLMEPFFVLDNDMKREDEKLSLANTVNGLGCITAIGLGLGAIFAFFASGALWGFGLLIASIALGWGVLKLTNAAERRLLLRKIYPRLALALAPLDPTQEELEQIKSGQFFEALRTGAAAQGDRPSSKVLNSMDVAIFMPILNETRARMQAAV